MSEPGHNVALLVSYDGRPYHGWQRLKGHPTIQGALEDAVGAAFEIDAAVAGSGRTDRGAHALGQVASFRLPHGAIGAMEARGEGTVKEPSDVVMHLNEYLQREEEGAVVVENAAFAPPEFHALHSCTGKTYRYALWLGGELPPEYERRVWHVHGDLDLGAMAAATEVFEGEHDFATFASKSNFDRDSTVRWLSQSSLFTEGPVVEMVFTGNGFLYKMVRNLVRAIVRVGEGRSTVDDLRAMLDALDRKAAPGSAPASGLYLDEAYYEPAIFPREDIGPVKAQDPRRGNGGS